MTRRKPSWLRLLCPVANNTAHLHARRCEACREWVAVYTGGPIEEKYDPGILEYGRDLTTALLLQRRVTRIVISANGAVFHLQDPCGPRGIRQSERYLCEHKCFTTPISEKPFKPPISKPVQPVKLEGNPTERELAAFERIWRTL